MKWKQPNHTGDGSLGEQLLACVQDQFMGSGLDLWDSTEFINNCDIDY